MNRPPTTTTVPAALAALLGAVALSGCGGGSAAGSPSAAAVPFVAGTHVVARERRCDEGRHAYCGLQLVLSAPRYRTSRALRNAETARLQRAGWAATAGDSVHERAAESPGHKLRLTYATGQSDLEAVDLDRIERDGHIARALAAQMFARAPTLSVMVQSGSS